MDGNIAVFREITNTLKNFGQRIRHLETFGSRTAQIVYAVTTVSADYDVLDSDTVVLADTSGVTITLPVATDRTGKLFIVKNIAAGDIDVDVDGGGTIDDDATVMLLPHDSMQVISDGTEWWII